ncbi:hypothetical protein CkaCkLH20_09799 [Colletotrichum karsti]|uniref:Pinin/SDK/MemA protein domain-containing protein n=1 Tax=Colletotrichum karsti TaxID=1095194 RepID=A0A9P6I5Z9_9PEZI|nr:uncharacterized protein CkaCkLH20_09799 [Colletotrichum karsti]KAF9872620.1 hypothetical protein CkaCkLH20_09799 [Colletotrichum karsti]
MATVTEYVLLHLGRVRLADNDDRAPADIIDADHTSPKADVSQKRKASNVSDEPEDTSKRARIEDDDRRDAPSQSSPTEPRRRESDAGAGTGPGRRGAASKEEEKKRGKRLFGGLLSTLSQTNTSSQHKKRREIEQRQQERAQKQRAEDDKRRAEKVAKVTESRWKEQINYDEKVMKTRHSNMLAMAHSLKTKAQPAIFYRPWKLTREQEDTIGDQLQGVKATIARELDAFEERREEHEKRYGRSRPPPEQEEPAPAAVESSADAPPAPDAIVVDAPAAETTTAPFHDKNDDADVVEDAEDTVIY